MLKLISPTSMNTCGRAEAPDRRLIYNPGDQLTYEVGLALVDGKPALWWQPYAIQMTTVDGMPTIGTIPDQVPDGVFDAWVTGDGSVRTLSVETVDGQRTITWE